MWWCAQIKIQKNLNPRYYLYYDVPFIALFFYCVFGPTETTSFCVKTFPHAENKIDVRQVSKHATKTKPQPPSHKRKMKPTLLLLSVIAIALISGAEAYGSFPRRACKKAGEGFSECSGHCEATCGMPHPICTFQCQSGCKCMGGYVRDERTNKCIRREHCPQVRRLRVPSAQDKKALKKKYEKQGKIFYKHHNADKKKYFKHAKQAYKHYKADEMDDEEAGGFRYKGGTWADGWDEDEDEEYPEDLMPSEYSPQDYVRIPRTCKSRETGPFGNGVCFSYKSLKSCRDKCESYHGKSILNPEEWGYCREQCLNIIEDIMDKFWSSEYSAKDYSVLFEKFNPPRLEDIA